jgi:hypothetical protein
MHTLMHHSVTDFEYPTRSHQPDASSSDHLRHQTHAKPSPVAAKAKRAAPRAPSAASLALSRTPSSPACSKSVRRLLVRSVMINAGSRSAMQIDDLDKAGNNKCRKEICKSVATDVPFHVAFTRDSMFRVLSPPLQFTAVRAVTEAFPIVSAAAVFGWLKGSDISTAR